MKWTRRESGTRQEKHGTRNYITPVTPGWAALTESHWSIGSDSSRGAKGVRGSGDKRDSGNQRNKEYIAPSTPDWAALTESHIGRGFHIREPSAD